MTHRRVWIALLIFSAVIINYIDRIALGVAARPIVAEYGFSPVQMGYLFSGFLWTYVICLVPLGMAVDRIGARRMMGGGIALWSTATALTAAAGSFVGILAARLVMGASEATSFPAGGRIIRDWFPARERGLVTTLFNGGSSAGPALGAVLTAALVTNFGWRSAFVALGTLGFVWLIAWLIWYRRPEDTAWLPQAERSMILAERDVASPGAADDPPPSSLGYLLAQPSLWGLVVTQACLVYTAYLFLTWMPTYLQSTRSLSTMNTGYLTAIPYTFTILFGLAIARISDRLLSTADIQLGRRRNFIAAMALLSLLILLAPMTTHVWQLLSVLTLVLTGSNTGAGLNFTLASDILRNPRDVARVIAMTAFGGNLFGLIAPIITGYVVAGTGSYTWAFRIAAALLLCGCAATLALTRRPIRAQFG